jgi:hypothetical protein
MTRRAAPSTPSSAHPVRGRSARSRQDGWLRFERWREPLLPPDQFLARLLRSAAATAGLIGASLLIGVLGYHGFCRLGWLDSLLNASMILGGMGPVDRIETRDGKLFASGYALYSGFALLSSVAVLVAPILHRFLHRFHLDVEEEERGRE